MLYKTRVLLHICCAVCATSCVERLRKEGYEVAGYFYNPNIQPEQEYLKRLGETEKLAKLENFPLIVGRHDARAWFSQTEGWENEPEGGQRCAKCFCFRLEKTAKVAQERGFAYFTTTLTVSPHKNAETINKIGQKINKSSFLAHDFKKQDGFKRAQELAKQYNLYHQNYCGCLFSLKERKSNARIHQKACSIRDKS